MTAESLAELGCRLDALLDELVVAGWGGHFDAREREALLRLGYVRAASVVTMQGDSVDVALRDLMDILPRSAWMRLTMSVGGEWSAIAVRHLRSGGGDWTMRGHGHSLAAALRGLTVALAADAERRP